MKLIRKYDEDPKLRQKLRSEQLHAIWRRVANETSSRLGSSGAVSIIMHAVIIAGYVALSTLYQPEVLEIREITFIDLTDDSQLTLASRSEVGIGTETVAAQKPEISQRKEPQPLIANRPSAKPETIEEHNAIAVKKAPIKLEHLAPQATNIVTPSNILNSPVSSGSVGSLSDVSPSKLVLEDGGTDRLSIPQAGLVVPSAADAGAHIKLTGNITIPSNAIQGTGAPNPSGSSEGYQNIRSSSGGSSASISGPLANRKIVKRAIPSFPPWAKKQGVGATIALRFTVMEDGTVKENIVVERTSGSSEWDHIVIKALRNWQFEPLEKMGVRYDQNGVITFHFVIT